MKSTLVQIFFWCSHFLPDAIFCFSTGLWREYRIMPNH
jgi:hypothetical protein